MSTESAVALENVTRTFGRTVAVDDVSFDIRAGEIFTLLGPSGCGKTTTLRLIAGFLRPDRGRILVNGTDVASTPSHLRNLGMVFQSYGLFPHLRVLDNVAFGLRMRRVRREERRRRALEALALVRMESAANAYPDELSGGQQQRVALARSLVIRPAVLLLDEPLGALDRKLREEMQVELQQLIRTVGITAIMVTHDQEEALLLSDRIAVMEDGQIRQIGAPPEIYHRPETAFVADFIGTSNIFVGERRPGSENGVAHIRVGANTMLVARETSIASDHVAVVIRPERIRIARERGGDANAVAGTVETALFLGMTTVFVVDVGELQFRVRVPSDSADESASIRAGDPVWLSIDADACLMLPADGRLNEGGDTG